MIFVTVGNARAPFYRLVKKVDDMAERLDEEMIIQLGYTKYAPEYAECFDFRPYHEIRELIKEARVVISHGGEGAIIDALILGKPIIAVPRLKKYKEHINDHQMDLVREMERRNLLTAVYDIEELEGVLKMVDDSGTMPAKKDQRLIKSLRKYVERIDAKCR